MSQTHRLAAIMFTDIVGYTALMGQDERKAFEFLKKNREIHQEIIGEYQGRWIKELGDGIMASFESARNATLAAIKIQEACRAAGLYQLRIGIHLADVVFENEDVFGDGVNLAARIQAMAPVGGIWVSESVHQNLVNKRDIRSEFVKTVELKNVREPVKVYRILLEGDPIKSPVVRNSPQGSKQKKYPWSGRKVLIYLLPALAAGFALIYFNLKNTRDQSAHSSDPGAAVDPSIAVLPFTDMSPDQDQAYLGDGLAEEIITVLSGINNLRVIGRTSSFQFKGEQMDLREIGKRLNAGTILEGSVQKSGDRIRITAQLIRTSDHSHLWSQRFDREMTDIFKIQDEIAAHIAGRLKLTLNLPGNNLPANQVTSPEAYTLYLKGLHAYNAQQYEQSIAYNQEALQLDSNYAASYAYIALAKAWIINKQRDFQNKAALADAQNYAYKSIALFPGLAEGYSALALLAWSIERDFPAAREFFEKSLQLNPNDALILNRYGYFLLWMADFDKASALASKAMELDPVDYNSYFILIRVNQATGRLDKAAQLIREGNGLFPDRQNLAFFEVNNADLSGDYTRVILLCDSILIHKKSLTPEFLAKLCIAQFKTRRFRESEAILAQLKTLAAEGAEDAGFSLATVYASRNVPDSCFYWLNRSLERLETPLRTLKIDRVFDPFRKHPQFENIYRQYGFDRYPQ
ncbi:MAG TPA: adenylate/guanylate cyclase domain-containing protein [Saprospiraceae bacterium]|nr:adenylate/guanylate cyclase domain-containing protein [Saprospiraceae bacterium]HNT19100.1 adenylate/guanylate cyclase domain-containing protein [Saprospiraceae bacterium]